MRSSLSYRHLLHKKLNQSYQQTPDNSFDLSQALDLKLHSINQSFTHNFHLQDIYLDIVRNKRTLRSQEIKHYYNLFTENKAESLIFINTLNSHSNLLLDSNQENQEALLTLKRLYCRLIEKMMVKISYFLMNRRTLSFMFNQIAELVKKCQLLMRRIDFLRDTSNINEVIGQMYIQNEQIQQKIIDQLINKGFLISSDQFYRINGIDLDHRQLFQRTQQLEQIQDQHTASITAKKMPKFQIDLEREIPKRLIKKFSIQKPIESKPQIQRSGWVDLQNKYRDLLLNLDQMINNQVDEITEVQQDNSEENIEAAPTMTQQPSKKQQESLSVHLSKTLPPGSKEQIGDEQSIFDNKLLQSELKASLKRTLRTKNSLKLPTMLTRVDINKDFLSEQEEQQKKTNSDPKTESYRRELSSFSRNSLSGVPDRKSRPSGTFPFFSKSFVSALKQMEKINIRDTNDRLGLKRMSEQILVFHKNDEELSLNQSKLFAIKNAVNKNRVNKSIIKLLNIYKNKREGEYVESIKKSVFRQHTEEKNRKQGRKNTASKGKLVTCQKNYSESFLKPQQDNSLLTFPAIEEKERKEIWIQHRASKQWINSQIQQMLETVKETPSSIPSESSLKRIKFIQSKSKYSMTPRPSVMSLCRFSPRFSHNPANANQISQEEVQAVNECIQFTKQNRVESNSIFTRQGIERARGEDVPVRYRLAKQNNQVEDSGNPLTNRKRVQVYDRVRRVILR